jgi:hypothetical protein
MYVGLHVKYPLLLSGVNEICTHPKLFAVGSWLSRFSPSFHFQWHKKHDLSFLTLRLYKISWNYFPVFSQNYLHEKMVCVNIWQQSWRNNTALFTDRIIREENSSLWTWRIIDKFSVVTDMLFTFLGPLANVWALALSISVITNSPDSYTTRNRRNMPVVCRLVCVGIECIDLFRTKWRAVAKSYRNLIWTEIEICLHVVLLQYIRKCVHCCVFVRFVIVMLWPDKQERSESK